jgi:hypothetical protein
MQLIESKTLATAQASIEFTSIPATFTDLVVVYSSRSTSDVVGNQDDIKLYLNNTTSTARTLFGTGSSTGSGNFGNNGGYAAGSTTTANTFSNNSAYIPNYTGTTNKSISIDSVFENNGTAAVQALQASLVSVTVAVTSLKLEMTAGNFAVGSSASLYGILKGSDGIVTTSP